MEVGQRYKEQGGVGDAVSNLPLGFDSIHQTTHPRMKFLSSLALSAMLATAAFAQNAAIGVPADGATVKAGSNMTVEVDRPVCRRAFLHYDTFLMDSVV